ncbi:MULTISPECIES: D-arabinono-1,4-lactone oxidase [unclassified Nocardioides]|uniref:D-arabinono-1,4-lactone oxidase n=1 Tax=unclassified Nocardioides TaxID=2615069 RepID=UPI0007016C73|nr:MULTISPECIES: D-arabinono-1,4-lactone oxidase [unclassified Nocardioides]KRA37275.1 FAD-linked oxidoreductase [Nocardioides sp. Root614]KRA91236.1 FAD-linked oxidoreductase [Nocardioides sp. Root682]
MSTRHRTRPDSWRNWSGLESASGLQVLSPGSADEVRAAVVEARAAGRKVKAAGTGHSFTAIAKPEHVQLLPDGMRGILSVDREAMTVTALAGTQLKVFNAELERLGLSLHNMGDIAEQTLAGAISTGTHGTGGRAAGLAAQVVGLELVTGTGQIIRTTADENSDVFHLARVGLGALGVITTITFAVEPLFVLRAEERPLSWHDGMAWFDDLTAAHDHVDMYWFPHADRLLTKGYDRMGTDLTVAEPLPRWRSWLDEDLLANTVFGAQTAALNRVPRAIPAANRFAARMIGPRSYSDVAHRVFTTERRVVFREMEYAVPREAGLVALGECRAAFERSGLSVSFPVEIRVAPADEVALSTSYGRDSFYLAFHTHHRADHEAYFALMESVMRDHGGRPHWGKLHSLDAEDLAPLYPRFGDFTALRDRLDPDRVFTNPYLDRVLGA